MTSDDRLLEIMRTQVALAYQPFDTVVRVGVDYLADEISDGGGEVDESAVERTVWDLADSLFAEHLVAQAAWPAVTDSDRLTAAFHELGRTGVATREAFTCCQNCGHSEILDGYERDKLPRGYVFYHQQDAERGTAGEGVYLAYGASDDRETLAGEVVEALRRHGLQPEWNGSAATRIHLPLTWQRRRTGRLAAFPGSLIGADFSVDAQPIGWDDPHAMTVGTTSAKAWAALRLPWLPTDAGVRLTAGDRTMIVRREWDRLVDDEGTTVGRHDAWALVSSLMGTVLPVKGDPEPAMLEVQYAQRGLSSDRRSVPMTLDECRWLLRTAPVHPRGNTIYESRTGNVVQHIWNVDVSLWLEWLDPPAQASHGRLVSPAEVDQVITVLALEDRIALGDLGPLETVAW